MKVIFAAGEADKLPAKCTSVP